MSQEKTIDYQSAMPPSATVTPLQRAFSNRAFLVAVIVMAVVGVGMQFMTMFMKVYFKKEPVPLRAELVSIPGNISRCGCPCNREPNLRNVISSSLGK